MRPRYMEFNGKHPAAKKEERESLERPKDSWKSYGVSYSEEFLKVDCDDYSHKTGNLENIVNGRAASDVVQEILDFLDIKYNAIATDNGKHFFFRKPEKLEDKNRVNWFCPLGIRLEWKFPSSDDHIPLKINGIERTFFKGSVDNTDIDELPPFLYPLQKGNTKPFELIFPEGDRTGRLGGYIFHLVDKGYTAEQAFQIVELMNNFTFEIPIPEDILKAQILNDSTFAKAVAAEKQTKRKDVSPESFRAFLTEKGMSLRYNELLNMVEFENIPEEYDNINDVQNVMPIQLQQDFKKYTGLKNITKQQVLDLILLESDKNSYNPVTEYLQDVEWDGIDRFPEIFNILGVQNELDQSLIRKWFYQTAAMPFNTLDDPFQPEGVLILMGEEGIGKTRFFAQLMPVPVWFSSLDKELTTKNKDILIQLLGAWVSEIGEIDRTFRANKSDVKNFMTLRMDSIRKPYAREQITKARCTSFCGTTNKDEFLNDDTGFRRWWVIPVHKKIDMGDFTDPQNLHQFWAQCHSTWKQDHNCFRLSDQEKRELEVKNDNVMETLPGEDELRLYLDFTAPLNHWNWIQPSALKNLSDYCQAVSCYTPIQIGKALTKISKDFPDMEKRKKNGVWKWHIPPITVNRDRYGNV